MTAHPSTTWTVPLLLACCLLLSPPVVAKTILYTLVSYHEGRYRVVFDVIIDAQHQRVREIMADYEGWPRFSSVIEEVRRITVNDNGSETVRMSLHLCLWLYCKNLVKTGELVVRGNGDIVVTGLPAQSDFRYASERWRTLAVEDKTRVKYQAELEPDFFVPPLIGPLYLKSRIRRELDATTLRLEQLAAQ